MNKESVALFNRNNNNPLGRVLLITNLASAYSLLASAPLECVEQLIAAEETLNSMTADPSGKAAFAEKFGQELADELEASALKGRLSGLVILHEIVAAKKAGYLIKEGA